MKVQTNSRSTQNGSPAGGAALSEDADAIRNSAGLIWGMAELLRGDYKQAEYGRVILPLVTLRRLQQVAAASDDAGSAADPFAPAGGTPAKVVADRLRAYIRRGPSVVQIIAERFEFDRQIDRLTETELLPLVVDRIGKVDLSPDRMSNLEMGYLFEELIRRFSEQSNETAGEHFTPREVVRLMVRLLTDSDLNEEGFPPRVSVFDCACGTGGMLSEAHAHLAKCTPATEIELFGQELNQESYAICLADMLVKGQDTSHIKLGNTLAEDLHGGQRFDYGIANPPFGVDWSKVEASVRKERDNTGPSGRFAPGLPRKSDGQLLFLLHLLSKMKPASDGGGRVAIVHNSSPLFSGGAGTGESDIRRHLIENDLLEAVIALPEQLFYNTSIASYVWLVTNRKSSERRGKVQLIDGRDLWHRMRRSLGEKRREMTKEHLEAIMESHRRFAAVGRSRIMRNEEFGYRAVAVERPRRARWEMVEATWASLEHDRVLRRLEPPVREALREALEALGVRRFDDEARAMAVVRDTLKSVTGEAGATVTKALVARCEVRDPAAPVSRASSGLPKPDPALRTLEHVPLEDAVQDYLAREVLPYAPDAWCPDPGGKIGYEIPFTRIFFSPPVVRASGEVLADMQALEADIHRLLREVLG